MHTADAAVRHIRDVETIYDMCVCIHIYIYILNSHRIITLS